MQALSRAIEKADRELEKNGKITPGEIAAMLEALSSAFSSLIKFLDKSPQFAGGQTEADYLKDFNDLSNSLRDEAAEVGANKTASADTFSEETDNYQRKVRNALLNPIKPLLTSTRETGFIGKFKSMLKLDQALLKTGKLSPKEFGDKLQTLTSELTKVRAELKARGQSSEKLRELQEELQQLTVLSQSEKSLQEISKRAEKISEEIEGWLQLMFGKGCQNKKPPNRKLSDQFQSEIDELLAELQKEKPPNPNLIKLIEILVGLQKQTQEDKKAKGPNAAQRGELEASFLGITQSLTTLGETLKVGEEKAGEKRNGHHGLDLKHEIELELIELREKVMKKHPSV